MENVRVLVVGELNIDLVLNQINGFPVIGNEILADSMNLALGSSSAIFASNIAALGIDTSFCGMVGRDLFGNYVLDELRRKNVDVSLIVQSDEHKTGATIVLNYLQDRANITYCGAMEHFNACIPAATLSPFNHLHFSSYFLQKGVKGNIVGLFKDAKDKGLTTSLDLQWDPDNKWDFSYKDCLPYVDLFLPNELEILMLSGEGNLSSALEKMGEYTKTIVVKRGIKGAVAFEKGIYTSSDAFLHAHFVDAIGAGDSFNAGFIAGHLAGASLTDCLELGNLAGAISTMAPGGTAAFESLESFKTKVKKLFNIVL